jgi:hypothetical protein
MALQTISTDTELQSLYHQISVSMSRWYGQGGQWINLGLPQYQAVYRKPYNGCEIQSCCCRVMLQLRLVNTNQEMVSLLRQQQTINGGDACC